MKSDIKYPTTSLVRSLTGKGYAYRRVKALEQWAMAHGYPGYRSVRRRTRAEKALQTTLRLK